VNKDNTQNKKMKKEKKTEKKEGALLAGASKENCNDKNCHIHGTLKIRGKVFEGRVIKKLQKRIAIEFERMTYIRKYERYSKSKTKIHARLQPCMEEGIEVGDLVQVRECRPLSKIIHFVVIKKIKNKDEK